MALRIVKIKYTNFKAGYEQSVVLLFFPPLLSANLSASASLRQIAICCQPLRPIAILTFTKLKEFLLRVNVLIANTTPKSGTFMAKVKILAFAGSARKDSCNKKLVKIAMEGAKEAGADVTYLDLNDYPLPLYHGDLEDAEGIPEDAQAIKKLMLEHDGWLIASPEYNSSLSGILKNTIDWVSRSVPNEDYLIAFKGKIASIMSASPGGLGGLRGLAHLRDILENIFMIVLPDQLAISNAKDAFDDQGQLKSKDKETAAKALGAKLVEITAKIKG